MPWKFFGCAALGLCLNQCVIVPAYQREHLADPTMAPTEDVLEARAMRKLHTVREGPSGGDGESAGGGCGCTN